MADNDKLSIEEILAAARQQDGGGDAPAAPEATPTTSISSVRVPRMVFVPGEYEESAMMITVPVACRTLFVVI